MDLDFTEIDRELNDFAAPSFKDPTEKASVNAASKKRSTSRKTTRHVLNDYKTKSRKKSGRRPFESHVGNNVNQLASQLSRINFQGEQIKVRKPPRSCRGMQVDPKRVQQPRKGKCVEAGVYKEIELAKRVIKEIPQPKKAPQKVAKPAQEQLVVDPKDPFAHIRID